MSGSEIELHTPLKLRGPIGMAARIPALQTPNEIVWESEGEVPIDLEILAQVVELGGMGDIVPQHLKWQIWSLGHGQQSYDFPPLQSQATTSAGNVVRVPNWPFPARGVAVRINCRRLRVLLWNQQTGSPLVRISFNPLPGGSGCFRPFPISDMASVGLATAMPFGFFPPHANEWRISNLNVDLQPPVVSEAAALNPNVRVVYFGWNGTQALNQPNGSVTVGQLFDWSPIPAAAGAWGIAQPTDFDITPIAAQAIYR